MSNLRHYICSPYYVGELKYKDIALVLDLPIGTVMSRISRARVALRQLLQPQFGESA